MIITGVLHSKFVGGLPPRGCRNTTNWVGYTDSGIEKADSSYGGKSVEVPFHKARKFVGYNPRHGAITWFIPTQTYFYVVRGVPYWARAQ